MSNAEQVGATRPATVEEDRAGAEHKPSGAGRLLHIVVAVLVALVLPALVIGAFVGELGVAAMFTGLLLGATGSKLGGTRRMLYVAPALGLAGGLGAYTAYDWWWVALLTIVAVITGAGIRFGWFAALLMVPFAATFITPVSTVTDAAIYDPRDRGALRHRPRAPVPNRDTSAQRGARVRARRPRRRGRGRCGCRS